jgi:hypothetical protein
MATSLRRRMEKPEFFEYGDHYLDIPLEDWIEKNKSTLLQKPGTVYYLINDKTNTKRHMATLIVSQPDK